MSAPFEPGDVVVCVDDRCREGHGYIPGAYHIRRGTAYRIAYCIEFAKEIGGGWGVALEGYADDGVSAWEADRFRRIDDEQYPEVLKLLRTLPRKAPADAE